MDGDCCVGVTVGVYVGRLVGRNVGIRVGGKVGWRVCEQRGFSEEQSVVFLFVSVAESHRLLSIQTPGRWVVLLWCMTTQIPHIA